MLSVILHVVNQQVYLGKNEYICNLPNLLDDKLYHPRSFYYMNLFVNADKQNMVCQLTNSVLFVISLLPPRLMSTRACFRILLAFDCEYKLSRSPSIFYSKITSELTSSHTQY